ncbi:hypothetical protein [Paenibacillus sp. SN-8-1]|uniref:hypothetical protein n=1 Tax=Paenibacillus sp. SN-8-1 TaxID=3435409 RepID=UPI003D9A2269
MIGVTSLDYIQGSRLHAARGLLGSIHTSRSSCAALTGGLERALSAADMIGGLIFQAIY